MKALFPHLVFLGLAIFVDGYGPQLETDLPLRFVFSNSSGGELHCRVGGEPRPIVEWITLNGQVVDTIHNLLTVLGNGSLQFHKFSPDRWRTDIHDTQFRCRASNVYGRIISTLVHVRAVIEEHLSIKVVGDPVLKLNAGILKCQIPSSMKHQVEVVSWKFGNSFIYPTKTWDKGSEFLMVSNGDLHISSVDYRHTHHPYFCIVRHLATLTNQESLPFHLTVRDTVAYSKPEQMNNQEFYFSVPSGDTVALPCRVQSIPPPTLSWFHVRNNLLQPVSASARFHSLSNMLLIQAVQISDGGQYRCTARNEIGEISVTLHLTVESPIVVDVVPVEQIIDIGRQARMECLTEEGDRDSIVWRKDGEGVPSNSRIISSKQTLQIFNLQREDYGVYQCFVTRGQMEAQATAHLRLGDASPYLIYEFIDQTLQPGPPVRLKCSARGSPTPLIEWTRNGFPLEKDNRFLVGQYVSVHGEVISHVNISQASVEDGGLYKCKAANRAGAAQHSARLNIYGPPVVHPMPEIKAVVGRRVAVICHASGYPLQRIVWSKGGEELSSNDRRQVLSNGTVIIDNVSATDAGRYTCTAVNRHRAQASETVDIRVIVAPKIEPFEFRDDLVSGKGVRQTCFVSEGDPPLLVSWFKDGQPVVQTDTVYVTLIDSQTSLLAITELGPQHSGNYSCVAKNEVSMVSMTSRLVVLVPPHWQTMPSDQSVVEGQPVTFHCQVGGVPPPKINWTVNSERRKQSFEVRGNQGKVDELELLANGSLVLWRVAVEDEGEYSCRAHNGVGDPVLKTVNLKINAPPRFMMEREGLVSAHQDQEVELVCKASGDDPIAVLWRKEGSELIAEPGRSAIAVIRQTQHITSTFRISKTKKTDSGRYECQASNPFGKSYYHIHLQIWEPPSSPQNLSLVGVTSRTARVSWIVTKSEPKVERFVIQWKKFNENWQSQAREKSLFGSVEEAILDNLRPSMVYQVRVFAENEMGKSKEGKIMEFVTDGERPGGSPRNIRITGLSATALEVVWDQPEAELCHGTILRYNIGYKEFNKDSSFQFFDLDRYKFDVERSRFTINGLRKFTKYEIVVQAVNKHGEGPLSEVSIGQTAEAAPDGSPGNVECMALSSTGLHLKWKAPPLETWNGLIKGYRVRYAPYPTPTEVSTYQKTGRVSAVIGTTTALTNLHKFTNYSVQILAYTAAGEGQYSPAVSCSTEGDVPGPPRTIKVVVKSSDSVVVTWLPPEQPNGLILQYLVYVREIHYGRERSHVKHQRPSEAESFVVSGLAVNQQHQFWVTAVTHSGEGRSSQVVTKTPSMAVEARITSIGTTVYQVQGSSVYLACGFVGVPLPHRRWYFQGKEAIWLNQPAVYGQNKLRLESVRREDSGNYTCVIDNGEIADSIGYKLSVQVPPGPPVIRIHRVTSNSVNIRWKNGDVGNSPIIGYKIKYKITYGEWKEKDVNFHEEEHTLGSLYCGRQYHILLQQSNYVGQSEPSQIVNTRTAGGKPEPPPDGTFIVVNTTIAILLLSQWRHNSCPILYFVVEYKLNRDNSWTIVTNNLQVQDVYSIRGLSAGTDYNVKITAHNHAGSTTATYKFRTVDLQMSGPSLPRESPSLTSMLQHLGTRATISILVSVLCLVLASVGVCFCIRKKQITKRPGRYDEMPKSATMENRQNLEQQFYATIQRKPAGLPPFSGYEADTIDQLKKAVRSQVEKIPDTASDISPYATSNFQQTMPVGGVGGGRHTMGRKETLRMTDYQKQKLISQADTIRTRDLKEGWNTTGRKPRRRYSESEEYDSESETDKNISSRTESACHLDQVERFNAHRYRTQFNL